MLLILCLAGSPWAVQVSEDQKARVATFQYVSDSVHPDLKMILLETSWLMFGVNIYNNQKLPVTDLAKQQECGPDRGHFYPL